MRHVFCGLAIALAAAGCSGGNSSSSTVAPTGPTATLVNETFSGTVGVSGNDFNPFTVTLGNTSLTVTLTAAGPPPTIFMGLGIGAYNASTCTLLTNGSVSTQAGSAAQLAGTISAGAYCVMVYDIGNQIAPVTYTVTLSHY